MASNVAKSIRDAVQKTGIGSQVSLQTGCGPATNAYAKSCAEGSTGSVVGITHKGTSVRFDGETIWDAALFSIEMSDGYQIVVGAHVVRGVVTTATTPRRIMGQGPDHDRALEDAATEVSNGAQKAARTLATSIGGIPFDVDEFKKSSNVGETRLHERNSSVPAQPMAPANVATESAIQGPLFTRTRVAANSFGVLCSVVGLFFQDLSTARTLIILVIGSIGVLLVNFGARESLRLGRIFVGLTLLAAALAIAYFGGGTSIVILDPDDGSILRDRTGNDVVAQVNDLGLFYWVAVRTNTDRIYFASYDSLTVENDGRIRRSNVTIGAEDEKGPIGVSVIVCDSSDAISRELPQLTNDGLSEFFIKVEELPSGCDRDPVTNWLDR